MNKGLLLGIAGLISVGCAIGGGVQTNKVAFVLPSGWAKAESTGKEATVGVPPGWRHGVDRLMEPGAMTTPDPNAPQNPQMTAEDKKTMEGFANVMNQLSQQAEADELDRLAKRGVILHCISTGAKPTIGEERTRFYLKKQTQNSNWNWPDAAATERDKYLHKPVPKQVKLPVGEATRMEETRQQVDGSSYTIVSYLIPNGRDLYTLRFVTQEAATQVTSIEKQVAESLRIN